MLHRLKTWPKVYEATIKGLKSFELRKNDRKFQVGDTLSLEEYDPQEGEYTGSQTYADVIYILEGGQFGLPKGYCIMQVKVAGIIGG